MTGPIVKISPVAQEHLQRAKRAKDGHHRAHAERRFALVVRWDNGFSFAWIHVPGERVVAWGPPYFPPTEAAS